jgi:hypothetical protein
MPGRVVLTSPGRSLFLTKVYKRWIVFCVLGAVAILGPTIHFGRETTHALDRSRIFLELRAESSSLAMLSLELRPDNIERIEEELSHRMSQVENLLLSLARQDVDSARVLKQDFQEMRQATRSLIDNSGRPFYSEQIQTNILVHVYNVRSRISRTIKDLQADSARTLQLLQTWSVVSIFLFVALLLAASFFFIAYLKNRISHTATAIANLDSSRIANQPSDDFEPIETALGTVLEKIRTQEYREESLNNLKNWAQEKLLEWKTRLASNKMLKAMNDSTMSQLATHDLLPCYNNYCPRGESPRLLTREDIDPTVICPNCGMSGPPGRSPDEATMFWNCMAVAVWRSRSFGKDIKAFSAEVDRLQDHLVDMLQRLEEALRQKDDHGALEKRTDA